MTKHDVSLALVIGLAWACNGEREPTSGVARGAVADSADLINDLVEDARGEDASGGSQDDDPELLFDAYTREIDAAADGPRPDAGPSRDTHEADLGEDATSDPCAQSWHVVDEDGLQRLIHARCASIGGSLWIEYGYDAAALLSIREVRDSLIVSVPRGSTARWSGLANVARVGRFYARDTEARTIDLNLTRVEGDIEIDGASWMTDFGRLPATLEYVGGNVVVSGAMLLPRCELWRLSARLDLIGHGGVRALGRGCDEYSDCARDCILVDTDCDGEPETAEFVCAEGQVCQYSPNRLDPYRFRCQDAE